MAPAAGTSPGPSVRVAPWCVLPLTLATSLHPQGRRDLPLLPLLGGTILLCSHVHTSGRPFSSHTAAPRVRFDVFSSGWRCSWLVGQCPWVTPPLTAAARPSVPLSWVAAGLERPSSQVYATHFLGALSTPPRLETAGVRGRVCTPTHHLPFLGQEQTRDRAVLPGDKRLRGGSWFSTGHPVAKATSAPGGLTCPQPCDSRASSPWLTPITHRGSGASEAHWKVTTASPDAGSRAGSGHWQSPRRAS